MLFLNEVPAENDVLPLLSIFPANPAPEKPKSYSSLKQHLPGPAPKTILGIDRSSPWCTAGPTPLTRLQSNTFFPRGYGTLEMAQEWCPAWGQLSPCCPPSKSGTKMQARFPLLHETWPSPCYPVLDVVEKTLRHERVLIQVDQVGCLGETNKESHRYALSIQMLRDAPKGGGNSTAPHAAPSMGSPAVCSPRTTCPGRYFLRELK